MKKVLNIGGGSKSIPLPPQYDNYEHILLDIDPSGLPDIVCDARELGTLEAGQFDVVYCSHNLEHHYHHEVRQVLSGFMHMLIDGGFVHIRVPDIFEVIRVTFERGLDIEDVLYHSPAGPVMALDVLFGYTPEIERSGQDFYAHKTGFTPKSLEKALRESGFSAIYWETANLEINALAFKSYPDPKVLARFGFDMHEG